MATITFEAAVRDGIILPNHYIAVAGTKDRQVIVTEKETGIKKTQKFTLAAEERGLWRLEQDEGELKLWGEPTKDKLTLCGLVGFKQGPDTMHRIIRELYDMPGIFETAGACSLTEKDYFFSDIEEVYQMRKRYERQDKRRMCYWLASRCVIISSSDAFFSVFIVDGGSVNSNWLYYSGGSASNPTYAVHPKATPKSTLLLERKDCDGSYERPWKCLGK